MAFFKCAGQNPTGNASTSDVLETKTFSNENDIDLVGTMTNNGAVSETLDTNTTSYTVLQGYHNGNGTVSLTTETKEVTAGTADVTESATSGKVISSVTVHPTPTETKEITAGTTASTTTPTAGKYISSVTVNPTPSQTKSCTPTTSAQTISPDSGKLLSSVSVSAISTETKTSTPTTRSATADTVTPTSGKYLTQVTVNTNSVPNSNSGTKTITSSDTNWYTGNVDMGATNSYRYVNAVNVYNKGKTDGAAGACKYGSDTVSSSSSKSVSCGFQPNYIIVTTYFSTSYNTYGISFIFNRSSGSTTYNALVATSSSGGYGGVNFSTVNLNAYPSNVSVKLNVTSTGFTIATGTISGLSGSIQFNYMAA